MPELPEVETTARILRKHIIGKVIESVETTYNSSYYANSEQIKNPLYFKKFKKSIINKTILAVGRRAKNVLIDLEGEMTILIHMKMTGHLLYNVPGRFIRLKFDFTDGTYMAFSDMRKFATVKLLSDKQAFEKHFAPIGPEPLLKNFDLELFKKCLAKKPNGKVKTVLMDHTVIAGIGNIYSDEILWTANVHPERTIKSLKESELKKIFQAIKNILPRGIDFGGDSMSDYLNPYGEKGNFQLHHEAYRRTGKPCRKRGCQGQIQRKVIGSRSAHFCPIHQK